MPSLGRHLPIALTSSSSSSSSSSLNIVYTSYTLVPRITQNRALSLSQSLYYIVEMLCGSSWRKKWPIPLHTAYRPLPGFQAAFMGSLSQWLGHRVWDCLRNTRRWIFFSHSAFGCKMYGLRGSGVRRVWLIYWIYLLHWFKEQQKNFLVFNSIWN